MKALLREFNDTLERRYSREYSELSMMEWICKNTTLRGMPFSTEGYEFQTAIANDLHPNLSCIKCSQVGLSEIEIRKALAFCVRNRGVGAIFSLPEEKLYRKIAQTRIKPIVEKDKIFNLEQDDKAVRSMSTYQFGTSFLYVTNCTEGDATSTSADAVFNDEVDLSDQAMLALFNSRLQNSDFKIKQGFSTPTFIGFGIDASFKTSDQHLWLYKCSGCGHWNWPEYCTDDKLLNRKFIKIPGLPDHVEELAQITTETLEEVDLTQAYVACEKCGSPLTKDDERQWVPKYPGRKNSRGYHVTPFTTTRLSVGYITGQLLEYRKNDYMRGFYNTVLGLPYSDANTQIPVERIEAAFTKGSERMEELPKDRPLVVGGDMGDACHVVIGDADQKRILQFRQVSKGDIEEFYYKLCSNHNIVAGGIDRYPYTPTAEKIRDLSKGVIMPVEYAQRGVDFSLVLDEYGNISHARAVRTKVLDLVANGFRDFEWEFRGYGHQKQIITEHLRDMVRDEKPEVPAVWKKLTGNDHYFHAMGYYLAALRVRPLVIEKQNEGFVGSMLYIAGVKPSKPQKEDNLVGIGAKRREVLGASE